MTSIIGIPYRPDNKYENQLSGKVQHVGYKTHRMKKIKVLKEGQYEIRKNVVHIIDKDIKMGTGDKIFIEA